MDKSDIPLHPAVRQFLDTHPPDQDRYLKQFEWYCKAFHNFPRNQELFLQIYLFYHIKDIVQGG